MIPCQFSNGLSHIYFTGPLSKWQTPGFMVHRLKVWAIRTLVFFLTGRPIGSIVRCLIDQALYPTEPQKTSTM